MPTYVLIHGAYQGGWIWKPVATRLRAAGHLVFAPTLDGCGERRQLVRAGITVGTHGREIAQLLFYEDLSDVVLVGTSSGGMVVQKAAELARGQSTRTPPATHRGAAQGRVARAGHRPLSDAERAGGADPLAALADPRELLALQHVDDAAPADGGLQHDDERAGLTAWGRGATWHLGPIASRGPYL